MEDFKLHKEDFTKEFFQDAWGKDGYYDDFAYGIGFKKVLDIALFPFLDKSKSALEIGSGGGTFTQFMSGKFYTLTAIDVIAMPEKFKNFLDLIFYSIPDKNTDCYGVADRSKDFVFSYNVFCHLSDDMIAAYLKSVHRVLKEGGDFVFMLSNFEKIKSMFPETAHLQEPGYMTPVGHFYQDSDTLPRLMDASQWEVVSPNLTPEHRDIIVHLRKK